MGSAREGESDRTQLVFVSHFTLLGESEHWVAIESPIGELGSVDIKAAAVAARGLTVGGISVLQGKYVTVRHSLPLANLDMNEFERPLQLVTLGADEIERRLSTGDAF